MSLLQRYVMPLVILMLFATPILADEIPQGVSVVTAPELRKMLAEKKVLVVNALSRIEYRVQHIPGSINIPVDELQSSSDMPADKLQPIAFYCNGVACPYSRRACQIAVRLGYKHVYWFKGGILEWRQFQYPVDVDQNLSRIKINKLSPNKFRELAKGNVLVLDVRPKWWRESAEKAGVIVG